MIFQTALTELTASLRRDPSIVLKNPQEAQETILKLFFTRLKWEIANEVRRLSRTLRTQSIAGAGEDSSDGEPMDPADARREIQVAASERFDQAIRLFHRCGYWQAARALELVRDDFHGNLKKVRRACEILQLPYSTVMNQLKQSESWPSSEKDLCNGVEERDDS